MNISSLINIVGDDVDVIKYIYYTLGKYKLGKSKKKTYDQIDEYFNKIDINQDNIVLLEKELIKISHDALIVLLEKELKVIKQELISIESNVHYKKLICDLRRMYIEDYNLTNHSIMEKGSDEYIMNPYLNAIENITRYTIDGNRNEDGYVDLDNEYYIYDVCIQFNCHNETLSMSIYDNIHNICVFSDLCSLYYPETLIKKIKKNDELAKLFTEKGILFTIICQVIEDTIYNLNTKIRYWDY